MHNMYISVWSRLFLAATAVAVVTNALNPDDEGVCSKTETYAVSQSERVATSFLQSYETCNFVFFCSTEYRTAYRTVTRVVYQTRSREYMVCCNGYVQIDSDCKPKVPSTTTTITASSTIPVSIPATIQATTAHQSTVTTNQVDNTTTPPQDDMGTALPDTLPFQTKLMVSGAIGIFVIIAIAALLLFLAIARRKRKQRPRLSSSNAEGNEEYLQPHGAYYSIIRSTTPGSDGAVADSSSVQITPLPQGSASGPPTPARTKKNTFRNLSLFYANMMKGRNKGKNSDHVQSYDSGSQAAGGEEEYTGIVHTYSDMDSVNGTPKRGTQQPQGYIDMRSPEATLAAGSYATAVSDDDGDGNVYSEMDNPGQSDYDRQTEQYNEFEPYDKLNNPGNGSPAKESPETDSYDHLERTLSLAPSAKAVEADSNPYDQLGGGGATEAKAVTNGDMEGGEQLYDHPTGTMTSTKKNTGEQRAGQLGNGHSNKPPESVYYNTPEENALKRRQSQQDAVYANVS